MIDLNLHPSKRELRTFGLLGCAFLALVAWIAWRKTGSTVAAFALVAVAAADALVAVAAPRLLRPVFVASMVVSFPFAWVATHVLMGAIFYLVVTPIAVIMRLTGRDPLERSFDGEAKTYWKARPSHVESSRYFRQF